MPTYGAFESRRLHAPGGLSSVYEAVALDGRAGRFALKIFHPPPSTTVRRLYAIEGWLLAAERQQRAAKAGGAAIEIVAWGRCEEGAFAVLVWADNSLEGLHAALSPRGDLLRALATRLLEALVEWEGVYGGPHGRLTPGNVFLGGSGVLGMRAVRLSDPWSMPGMKVEELRRRDLAAVGALLVEVVRRRAAGGWPIEDAPEWHALGRSGAAWREYCNYLMSPAPAPADHTLADALKRLQRIPRDSKPGRTAGLAGGGLLVVGAVAVLGFARFGSYEAIPAGTLRSLAERIGNPAMKRAEVAPEWALLCRAWETWSDNVKRSAERWEGTAALWGPADPLRAALAAFRGRAEALDPRAVVPAAAGSSLNVLATNPPAKVRDQLLRREVSEKVGAAWAEVNALATALDAWPGWAEFETAGTAWAGRGRPRLAAKLRALASAPTLDPAQPDLAARARLTALKQIADDPYGALALLPMQRDFTTLEAALVASGDRVQAALPALVLRNVPDGDSLGDLTEALAAPLAELLARRDRFLAPEVERERFLRDAPVLRSAGEVTAAELAAWDEQLALYSRLSPTEDPRRRDDWDSRIQKLNTSGADIEPEAPAGESALPPLGRPDLEREVSRLGAAVTALRARPGLRVDAPSLESEVAALRAQFDTLDQRIEATLALLRPELWLEKVSGATWRLAAVRARWDEWRGRALASATPSALRGDRARFRALRQAEREARAWLEGLEGVTGLGEFAPPAFATDTAPETTKALLGAFTARTERDASAILAASPWSGDTPPEPWAVRRKNPALEKIFDTGRSWRAALPDFARDLDQLGTRLRDGFGWAEGVEEALARANRLVGIETLEGAVANWLVEARRLGEIAKSTDRAALVAAAAEPGLSLRLTAWRRLGSLPEWPSGTADLDLEGDLLTGLRTQVASLVRDASRRESLENEFVTEMRARWNRAARRVAGNPEDLAAVFSRMERFKIGENNLEPPVAFNLRLWQLKNADWAEDNLDILRARRDAFVSTVRSLPDVTALKPVAGLLGALGELALRDDPTRQAASTPRRAGWQERLLDGGERVVATWEGGGRRAELEFVLVRPPEGAAPFFLARRVLAVGEFADLIAGRAEGRNVLAAMPAWVRRERGANEPWTAPLAWRPTADGAGIEVNTSWIYRPAPEITPTVAEAIGNERPNLRSPMQRIPPEAARAFAEQIVGARLPTPDEWKALLRMQTVRPTGNFRAASFGRLWNFLGTYRAAEQSVAWRPNQGIFLPLQAAAAGSLRRVPLADDGQVVDSGASSGAALWPAAVDAGPETAGFTHLLGNVWIYLYQPEEKNFYVAGGSVLSPPGLDPAVPQRVEGVAMIGAARGAALGEGFSDVGIRLAFDAPPGLRERFEMLRLVRTFEFLK